MSPAAVVIQEWTHASAEDARFALRELQTLWPDTARLVLGLDWRAALAVLPDTLPGPVLLLRRPMLTLESRCLPRLTAVLAAGEADVALACDSGDPGPMPPAAYATLRGMERFVDATPVGLHPQSADAGATVELATLEGLHRRSAGQARIARVAGAWAHDAGAYFASDRLEALPLLPPGLRSLLDVGGGEGAFLAAVKAAHPAVHTSLVELTADAADVARARGGIDHVWQTDFLSWEPIERFDCISFLDVLEHLPDPEAALRKACSLLTPGGSVLLSIPNVGHASVIADLIEGRWDWAPVGIHCYTHLRFFTRHTLERLLQRAGLRAVAWDAVRVPMAVAWQEAARAAGLQPDVEGQDVYAWLLRAEPL